jgi:crotonobetainyl-CoA:carnitine CoA-transferase CaiB-like acyl-CoA transferase
MQDICTWLTRTAWNKALDGRVEPAVIKAADGYVFIEAGLPALEQAHARFPELAPTQKAALERTVADLAAALPRAGLHAVPVQTVRQSAMMPHTLERKLWSRKQDGDVACPVLTSPLRLPTTPFSNDSLALPIDHDRKEILAELGLPGDDT